MCRSCFADHHLRGQHKKKTSNHYFFDATDNLEQKEEIPSSENIAVIGIWEIDQNGRPKCNEEYFMENPLYFPKNYGKDSDEILEKVFIH